MAVGSSASISGLAVCQEGGEPAAAKQPEGSEAATEKHCLGTFPRLPAQAGPSPLATDEEQIYIKIRQRRGEETQTSYEVCADEDGRPSIPMVVRASTLGITLSKEAVLRSPWLTKCLSMETGGHLCRHLGQDEEDEEDPFSEDGRSQGSAPPTARAVVAYRLATTVLELALPTVGACSKFLSAKGFVHTLESRVDGTWLGKEVASPTQVVQCLAHFLWAVVLELEAVTEDARKQLTQLLDLQSVALVLAAASSTTDAELLRHCYWCLRKGFCGSGTGVPADWLQGGSSPTKLIKGMLSYKQICRTRLRVLSPVLEEDLALKQQWTTVTEAYTLCQVYRTRQEDGGYPHIYELRLDHSGEVLLTAIREDEQSPCRLFSDVSDPETCSEHSEAFLGAVCANFWGTEFTLFDTGCDRESLIQRFPVLQDLPLRQRNALCKIGYSTNIMGDCPRKVSVDLDRNGKQWHMENMAPRWDKKLNSYALPFFGRVKKASAKNFQLIVDDDPNTIFLMFGKISKDVFCLDFRSPLSLLDAAAIACAALAKKRAVS